MLRARILKYVARPQLFAFMPPKLAAAGLGGGILLWLVGTAAGFGPIPGMIVGFTAAIYCAWKGLQEPHTDDILTAHVKYNRRTPNICPEKAKTYVS